MKLKLDDKGNAVLKDGPGGTKLPVYVHDDGKEVEFDAAATVATIRRLNGEAQSHREAREAAEGKLKSLEGIDDPEAARKAIETMKNIKDGELIAAGKVEEIKAAAKKAAEEQVAAANKAHAEELNRYKTKSEGLESELFSEKIGGSFTRSKMISEKFAIPPDLVQAKFGSNFKVEEGKIVAYDASGSKIYSRARPGELATFDEALESLVETYPYKAQILKGSGASGGGAGGGAGGAFGQDLSKLSPVERMNAVRAQAT